jgi:hypothetical protein
MPFHFLAPVAEFERDLIAERTRDGLAAARARHGGKLRVRGPSIRPDKLAVARQLHDAAIYRRSGSPKSPASPAPACIARFRRAGASRRPDRPAVSRPEDPRSPAVDPCQRSA